jgi:hypothetical protein
MAVGAENSIAQYAADVTLFTASIQELRREAGLDKENMLAADERR